MSDGTDTETPEQGESNSKKRSRDDRPTEDVRVVDRRWWARNEAAGADAAATPGGRKPTYVEDLEQQLADARNRVQELTTGHRQSLDEFEQARVRLRRDVGREVERGRRTVLVEFLDVLDNLDRAAAAFRGANDTLPSAADQLGRGVELVRDQFIAKLESLGVSRVPALGELFDATRHEAVSLTPVADAAQDGVIVAVVREGYAMGGDLLRPASVVVGRSSD
jgi:molecular chaperone GrpE